MARRLIIAIALVPLLAMVGGIWALRAQTISPCGVIYALHLITEANAQVIISPCASGTPTTPGDLLLEDNSSFLLLEDGTSKLCLEAGC